MIDLKAIEAFDYWWNTRPEPHISAPRECHVGMQQERMMAIWMSAWDAATQAKTLSEPEIHWIAQRFYHTGLGIDPVQFCKAIEERHGIK